MLGFEFDDNARPYAIDNFVESMGCVVFEIFEAFVGNRRQYIIYNLLVGFIGIAFNAVTLTFKFKPMVQKHFTPLKHKETECSSDMVEEDNRASTLVSRYSPLKVISKSFLY